MRLAAPVAATRQLVTASLRSVHIDQPMRAANPVTRCDPSAHGSVDTRFNGRDLPVGHRGLHDRFAGNGCCAAKVALPL
jgi:hypothetical protein